MQLTQAKQYMGKVVRITYKDRTGNELTKVTHLYDVAYVPSYGVCLVGDSDDIWLDKVTEINEAA